MFNIIFVDLPDGRRVKVYVGETRVEVVGKTADAVQLQVSRPIKVLEVEPRPEVQGPRKRRLV